MKYGESSFDILYLLFAIVSGFVMLVRSGSKNGRLMGIAALILGFGDAFHLVPRVMNYFTDDDLTAALGIGKLITSITMTAFYVLAYYIHLRLFGPEKSVNAPLFIWIPAAARVILCLFPQNGWLENENGVLWGVIRNVPFVILGAAVCLLYFKTRRENALFKRVWLYVLLSFAFYTPVVVAAGAVPMLGMLMLPKTVCYILIICVFLRYALGDKTKTATEEMK